MSIFHRIFFFICKPNKNPIIIILKINAKIFLPHIILLLAAFVGYNMFYNNLFSSPLADTYKDSFGEEWRVPPPNFISTGLNIVYDYIPRVNFSFKLIPFTFDPQNSNYLQSAYIYLLISLAFGVFITLLIILVLVSKFCCNCCGGKSIPREGYSTYDIDSSRGFLLVASFIVEFMLILSFFANTEVDKSMLTIRQRIYNYAQEKIGRLDNFTKLIEEDKLNITDTFYNKSLFEADLKYSKRAIIYYANQSRSQLNVLEVCRMILVIATLAASTVACTFGIVAGTIYRPWPIWIMIYMSLILIPVSWAAFGLHYAIGRSLYEFCTDIKPYISLGSRSSIPQNLQYFFHCVNSPVFLYIDNYILLNSLLDIRNYTSKFNETGYKLTTATNCTAPFKELEPYIFNISDPYYSNIITDCIIEDKRDDVNDILEQSRNISSIATYFYELDKCRDTKADYRNEEFLICTYTQYNMQQLTVTQGLAAFFLIFIAFSGIGSILKFKWTEITGLAKFDGQAGFAGRAARPKRTE